MVPPYARFTVFLCRWRREVLYSVGLKWGIYSNKSLPTLEQSVQCSAQEKKYRKIQLKNWYGLTILVSIHKLMALADVITHRIEKNQSLDQLILLQVPTTNLHHTQKHNLEEYNPSQENLINLSVKLRVHWSNPTVTRTAPNESSRYWTHPSNALPSYWTLRSSSPLCGGLKYILTTYIPQNNAKLNPDINSRLVHNNASSLAFNSP